MDHIEKAFALMSQATAGWWLVTFWLGFFGVFGLWENREHLKVDKGQLVIGKWLSGAAVWLLVPTCFMILAMVIASAKIPTEDNIRSHWDFEQCMSSGKDTCFGVDITKPVRSEDGEVILWSPTYFKAVGELIASWHLYTGGCLAFILVVAVIVGVVWGGGRLLVAIGRGVLRLIPIRWGSSTT